MSLNYIYISINLNITQEENLCILFRVYVCPYVNITIIRAEDRKGMTEPLGNSFVYKYELCL